MNHHRRTTARLGRPEAILAAGVLALVSVTGCGPAVSSASPILTATLAPSNAVGPTASTAEQTAAAAPTTSPTATQTPPSAAPATGTATAITVGGNHVCVLPGDGTVLCWGDNTSGQLGKGEKTDPHAPAGDVLSLYTVIAAANSGAQYTCDQITDETAKCRSSNPLSDVVAIAAGYAHTCALLADTTVKCWGANAATPDGGMFGPPGTIGGALGDGTAVDRPAPVTVIAGPNQTDPLSGVRALSAAVGYTCALLLDTTVKCWGDGYPGNSPQTASLAPVTVMADDGASPLSNVAAISAGDFHACALMTDSSVKCWGGGSTMPVSVTTPGAPVTDLEGATAISADHGWPLNRPNGISTGHTCALTEDTKVVCWGLNDVSQLGNGGHDDQPWAGNVVAAVGTTEDLTDVAAIASGAVFTCALMKDATVKCWGMNFGAPPADSNGFEGAGAPVAIDEAGVVAIAAGGWACGVLSDGSIRCWGSGDWVVPDLIASMGPIIVAPTPTGTP